MKISVITATWNSGKTIGDTLRSVLNQSFTNVEHIIKDGGSKDDTLEICKSFEQKYYTDGDKGRTINILSDKDKGIYDAMNQGIEAATGDVIGILNSDDFYTSDDVLARVAEEFEKSPELEAVYGDIHFVKDENLKRSVPVTSQVVISVLGHCDSDLCRLIPVFMYVVRFMRSMVSTILISVLQATLR